jgi:hypothetical protein
VTEVDKGLPTCNFDEPCACNNIHPLPPPAGDIVGHDPRSGRKTARSACMANAGHV